MPSTHSSLQLNKTQLYGGAAAVVVLLLALVGSWLWFWQSQQQAHQAQLNQLAAQARSAQTTGKGVGRAPDPYRDEAVKNTIRKAAADLQKPWLAYLEGKPAKTEGTVEVDWQISPEGKVLQPAVVSNELGDARLGQGIVQVVGALTFPPPPLGQAYYVAHKFRFKKENAS